MEKYGIMVHVNMKMVNKCTKIDRQKREMPMCLAVANRIINRTNAQNEWRYTEGRPKVKLTGKRLQKLLYLCQLFWYTGHSDSNLLTEDFQAWPNGPVITKVYDYFSVYQDGDMCPLRIGNTDILSEEESTLINKVVDSTIDISTEAIIGYTHTSGGPWDKIYKNGQGINQIIPKELIRNYISQQNHQEELIDFIGNG